MSTEAAPELMPTIRREGLVGVVIHTTCEQLSNLHFAFEMVRQGFDSERIMAEVPEWAEAIERFTDSGWEKS